MGAPAEGRAQGKEGWSFLGCYQEWLKDWSGKAGGTGGAENPRGLWALQRLRHSMDPIRHWSWRLSHRLSSPPPNIREPLQAAADSSSELSLESVPCSYSRWNSFTQPSFSLQGRVESARAIGSALVTNTVVWGDGIPVELFQILKDDAVKVLHSICQQIWKTQQWPQDWKMSVFIPIPKKGKAKECSNYHTIVLISHASKVILKNSPSQASAICELWTSRCSSWI